MGLNQAQNEVFRICLNLNHMFSLKLYTMIVCDNVLHLVEVKSMKKNLEPKFGPNLSKLGPKLGFLPFSHAWFISFPLNCIE